MDDSKVRAWKRGDLTPVDELYIRMTQRQEQHLIPLKEDVADWLNKTLDVEDITADNFMSKLDNGVVVCRLATLLQARAEGSLLRPFKCWENAKSGSFFARDNTENFLRWCRKFGVNEAVMFESDDLVLHSQARSVVLCLLELGRIASKFGVEPPGLVKLEKEIEELSTDSDRSSACSSPPLSRANFSDSSDGTKLDQLDHDASGPLITNCVEDNVQGATDNSSSVVRHNKQTRKLSELDQKVRKIASRVCHTETQIKRISEGRYCIGGRIYFVRLLKEKHVMIRVGGGWDTLEHFLSRHDTCNVILLNRRSSIASDDGTSSNCSSVFGTGSPVSPGSPTNVGLSRPRYRSPASSVSLTSLSSLSKP
ncbi:growth arrest-specific protein 2-like isoform X2 [Ornithodoros turicata]|uniref:growth arrest-specific protein 2-like isoform X2 n=1 Tax=Ornithodoros turicata TaxID=34597 RepID=UPI003139208D